MAYQRKAHLRSRGDNTSQTLDVIRVALSHLDARCGHDQWFRIGAAIHTASNGDGDGLDLFDAWSSTGGTKYPGRRGIERQWRYYGQNRGKRITLATLRRILAEEGYAWQEVVDEAGAR